MCPYELMASVTVVAAAVAQGRTAEEISTLGAVFTQLGDSLATIAVQMNNCNQ